MNRRAFLSALMGATASFGAGCASSSGSYEAGKQRLFFTSSGKTCLINADGSGFRVLNFDVPNQATWQPGPFFSDGRRMILLSMEPRRDGPGRPFEEYYTQTPTHIWAYDIEHGSYEELCTQHRMAPFQTPALLINDTRLLVQVVRNKIGQIWSMNLDGSDAREFTRAEEGFPYGLSLSPDGRRIAFHTAGPAPHAYRIWTSDADGSNRTLIVGDPAHLYFGPVWSPDGRWLAYHDCRHHSDPGHDWSDVCVGRPEGGEHRVLTTGQSQWFGATYGNPANRGGGSNMLSWTHDGRILVTRRQPGSKVPWEFQAQRPDTDHFNRDWKPELAQGGTEIGLLNPTNGMFALLTPPAPGRWNCRPVESPDGKRVAFLRCSTGESPSLWITNADGSGARFLTGGIEGQGADHPRWLPHS
jgi:TolB protein